MALPAADPSVLIIDDEPDLCRLLVFNLVEAGFATFTAATAAEGMAAAATHRPSVVVLDLMLPDTPGAEVCRRLRADAELADVAILMLTARGDEYDRLMGFELGADNYVVKPYNVREVVLRVKALARRVAEIRAARAAPAPPRTVRWRMLELDATAQRVVADGVVIDLRPLELKLLSTLLENAGRVLSREELLEEVWGMRGETHTRTVDTHVRRLRARLGVHGGAIETVFGHGYRVAKA